MNTLKYLAHKTLTVVLKNEPNQQQQKKPKCSNNKLYQWKRLPLMGKDVK